jgi:hypothetical protein
MGTKIAIKSEGMTPFGGFYYIMDQFDRYQAKTIDSRLGIHSMSVDYLYSEIIRDLFCIYCGGECVEDVSSYIESHLLLRPHTGVFSPTNRKRPRRKSSYFIIISVTPNRFVFLISIFIIIIKLSINGFLQTPQVCT